VKSIVYGGLDAIVTSFALVASVSGGDLPAGECARASLAVYVCVCVSLSLRKRILKMFWFACLL
jgi:hypothetical protein